ncbi:MAG: HAMP domain-containing histidine kinase [Clostridiales bacterium]|jgi:signal transduction histidine kinase|nr:HAMP domain-containing histidine kinase [Clostridiales bacterium]
MAPRADGKQISAGFAVFLITFLVLTTFIVFAVLLFLSYENMYNNLILDVESETKSAANDLASDITSITSFQSVPFEYTNNDDGTDNFRNSRIIDKFVNSQTYRSNGSVYVTDKQGKIYCRNSFITDISDNLLTTEEGPLYIVQPNALELLERADSEGYARTGSHNTGRVISINCVKVRGTPYFVLVSNSEGTEQTKTEYINVILIPALVAMIIAIVLYAVFVYFSLMPIKDISQAISKVAEGDYSVRVSSKYSDPNDYTSLSVSSEFTEMGRTVNKMIESLENQEHDREMFISSIAHDIRTPLTSINGFVTAMLDGTIPEEKQPHYLELIKQQTDRIRTLVTQMTEASSLSHPDPDMMEEFNINDMINDIVDNLEAQLTDKQIRVIKSLDPGPGIMVYGEAQQLCRVIINIITNAIKFTPQNGEIKISTETNPKARKVIISVEDSGAGVEESKRQRIFESFYQADSSRKSEGFGLGLYICKQILAGHGQTIICDEGRELGGARFVFSFPYPPEKQEQ